MAEPTPGRSPGAAESQEAAAQAARHDPVYDRLHDTAEFQELRKRYRGFVLPATIAFLLWYLLYVIMSNWAGGFMSTQVFGHVNVALIFGLLQFVTTFGLAYLYSRFSNARLDPLAGMLEQSYRDEVGTGGRRGQS